jgi:hypothetical protein
MSKYRGIGVVRTDVTTTEVIRIVEELDGNDAPDPVRVLTLLRAAIDSQRSECSQARRILPVPWLEMLYHAGRGGLADRVSRAIEARTLGLLRRLGLQKPPACDIMISHPSIDPEIAWIGRPGVRLPYVPMFALHYSVYPDQVTGTFARGGDWNTPNQQVLTELEAALRRIARLLAAAAESQHTKE